MRAPAIHSNKERAGRSIGLGRFAGETFKNWKETRVGHDALGKAQEGLKKKLLAHKEGAISQSSHIFERFELGKQLKEAHSLDDFSVYFFSRHDSVKLAWTHRP